MNMEMNIDSKYQLKMYGANIANINYFNDKHKIIRVEFNKNLYDFKCLLSNDIPNPISRNKYHFIRPFLLIIRFLYNS